MKKLFFVPLMVVALVGCSSPSEPDYNAFVNDVNRVSSYKITPEEMPDLIETADMVCASVDQLGLDHTATIIQLTFMTNKNQAKELAKSLDENICSRLP